MFLFVDRKQENGNNQYELESMFDVREMEIECILSIQHMILFIIHWRSTLTIVYYLCVMPLQFPITHV